ncbi:hypothetical protein CPB86DRAFT_780480 [Serendipita vermifera]|nr:hypothetical protein CPB86DRAFT_780480 [Serendipita vermifera]
MADDIDFEVKGPQDAQDITYDLDDDLTTPLTSSSREMLRRHFPVPNDLLDIDIENFDAEAAIKRYGYKFDDCKNVPKNRALLIGIRGQDLKGCHNDIDDMKALLIDVYKWRDEDIMMLKDESLDSPLYPTRSVVLDHLFILVHNTRQGDKLFIHFSGHGAQIEDQDGDEADGLDEVIVCGDGKVIVDDQLHDILIKPLPKGANLIAVFDCCASGTGLDLRKLVGTDRGAIYSTRPEDEQFNATYASGALDLPHAFMTQEEVGIDGTKHLGSVDNEGRKKYSDGQAVMWAACKDNADSHEVKSEGGRYNGAMSRAFVQCLRQMPSRTYMHLLDAIIEQFHKWNLTQVPQLTSAQRLDPNAPFQI